MTLPDAIRDGLASSDPNQVRDAVRVCTGLLRKGRDVDPVAMGELLFPHATHPKASVRQAVAEACELVPGDPSDRLLEGFLHDSDGYVQRAAARVTKKRTAKLAEQAREDGRERYVAEVLDTIQAKYGKAARRVSERAVRLGMEYFVRLLNHELDKIITALEFSSHRISSGLDRPDFDRHALRSDAAIVRERIAFLRSVIDGAREYTATVTPQFREERLAALVDEARGHLLDRLGPRAGRVVFFNDVGPQLRIEAHGHGLLQAFQNILQNGAEAYEDSSAPIELRVSSETLRAGAQVVLSFTDKGAGMSEERQQHLFRPFSSRKPGGTGVGLLIARKMVEEVHGGTLEAHSVRGEGTTLKLTLPVRQKEG